MQKRPDGSVATAIGWVLIVIGVIFAFIAATAQTSFAIALTNLGIGLGVVLVSLGYLVRAIWFLPGREIPLHQSIAEQEPTLIPCDYCGLDIAAPLLPCSAISAEELMRREDEIDDEKCTILLRERGILPTLKVS